MACPAVISGDRFLTRVIEHVDCQAQAIGSVGFQALAAPGSPTTIILTSALTIFVALLGYRLLFGPAPQPRDLALDGLKVGVVLTLALSLPAWRVLAYDVILHGPADIVAAIAPRSLGDSGAGLLARLQEIEQGIQALTASGAGRNVGELLEGDAATGGFSAIALADEAAFGNARLAFLAGTIAPLAILRITGGLLLALTPLAAGLLLFGATRGLFAGWLRGLVFVLAGSIATTLVLAAEGAVLEPWLTDALNVRSLGYAMPSAPTELLAMTVAFAITAFGLLLVLGRVAFHPGWQEFPLATRFQRETVEAGRDGARGTDSNAILVSRALRISESVRMLQQHETHSGRARSPIPRERGDAQRDSRSGIRSATRPALGSSWKRTSRRTSRAAGRRDVSS